MTYALDVFGAITIAPQFSDPTRRSWQLRRIKSEFLAGSMYDARVEGVARASQWNSGFSPLAMHRHRDVTFVTPGMLVTVNAASMLNQPFSKCRAFHCTPPMA